MSRKSGLRKVGRLRRLLRRLPDAATAELRIVISEWAEAIEIDAKLNAPVQDGDLRDGISRKFNRDGLSARVGYLKKADQKKAFYAPFVHFGTQKTPPNPFLFNAYEQNKSWGRGRAQKAITKALDIASRGAGNE